MKTTRIRVPKALWWIASVVGIFVLAAVTPVSAGDCPAVDQYDLPRDCTATERLGQCLDNAMTSYSQCLSSAHSRLMELGCYVAFDVDFYACFVSTAISTAFDGARNLLSW